MTSNEEKYTILREQMVNKQLAARHIRDKRVLQAFSRVPRHLFVNPSERDMAYQDHPLPIGKGQTISQPYIVALMTEVLKLKGKEKVLEVGTGSGYQAAILAELAEEVFTVERIPSLQEKAKSILGELGYHNINFKTGDGSRGWPEKAPFDGILVTAAARGMPSSLVEQLSWGGRLVIPSGNQWMQDLLLIIKEKEGLQKHSLGGCSFVPLIAEDDSSL